MKKFEKEFLAGGKTVKVTSGNFGFRADTALMLQQGETVVMVFVTVDTRPTDLDYFPLGINYIEKFYAGGIISGSRFIKREGRPSDDAIIKGRVIDRALRPLFPGGFKNAVNVVVNVMAYDGENDPAILAANAAAMAVHASSVPFFGPVASMRIGMDENGQLLVNPDEAADKVSKLEAIVSTTRDTVTQLEIGGFEVEEDKMKEAFDMANKEAQAWLDAMEEVQKEIGKKKLSFDEYKVDEALVEKYASKFEKQLEEALLDDENRNNRVNMIHAQAAMENEASETPDRQVDVTNALHAIEKKITRGKLREGKRLSGRALDEIREIEIVAPFLPRVHGSAMFRRGVTQALSITTLGSTRLSQMGENFEGEFEKHFMHHYSGPGYSVGEAGRFNFYAGNREIGHGALAEKALKPVIPSQEEFPYTIRVVSEVLSQNGSTSMASTCGASLSLMDAGVPIKAAVAGISIGLITFDDNQSEFKLLTDVQDVEDHYGDMDFKVTGTRKGITAIQMDTKLKGVKINILKDGLDQAKLARNIILDKFDAVLAAPRADISPYAPKVKSIKIPTDQIGLLIGPGGKNIKGILEEVENKVDVDIQDDGQVNISGINSELVDKIVARIKGMTQKPEVGEIYEGFVDKIMPFGAFVDVSPTITGLVHVSEIADGFVKDVNEHLKVDQKVKVKVIGIDGDGKIKLSIKQALEKSDSTPKSEQSN